MAVINDPNTAGNIAQVGPVSTVTAQQQLHVYTYPIPHGALGHYRVHHHATLVAAQVARSRLFEIRNTHASNLLVITRLVIRYAQTAAGTPQVGQGLDIFHATAFSVVDTTNTVTPTVIAKRTGFAAAPGAASVRGVTVAGIAAGMTGGTITIDASPFSSVPVPIAVAAGTTVQSFDIFDDVNGTHPFVLGLNEGIEIENRILNVTSYGVDFDIDMSWAEVTAF